MATSHIKPAFQTRVLRTYSKWALDQTPHIIHVQRWWRRLKRLQPSNTTDCITLEPLEKPLFLHVSEQGHVTGFTAETLAQYMVSSGNFTHPQFRTPFNAVELQRLDKCTGRRYQLLQNRDNIQLEQARARNESSLTEFLVNEFTMSVQQAAELCTRLCSRFEAAEHMQSVVERLILAFVTLRAHDQAVAAQQVSRACDTIETAFSSLADSLSDMGMIFEFIERYYQLTVLFNMLRNNDV